MATEEQLAIVKSIPPRRMLGKLPVRIDPRTFKLSKYLKQPLAGAPSKAGYVKKVSDWGVDLNDQLGDCTIACAAHQILQWSTYVGTPKRITDAEILTAYEAVSRYVPGDPSTDNGAIILDVLNYWRKHGIGGHKILAYATVDWTNVEEMRQAIYLFGSVYLGIQLPVSAQETTAGGNGHQVWRVPPQGLSGDGLPGSWGGHAIPICQYGRPDGTPRLGVEVVTWGDVYNVTYGFLNAYADEAYVILSSDWIAATGLSVSGFDLAQLQSDLEQL